MNGHFLPNGKTRRQSCKSGNVEGKTATISLSQRSELLFSCQQCEIFERSLDGCVVSPTTSAQGVVGGLCSFPATAHCNISLLIN